MASTTIATFASDERVQQLVADVLEADTVTVDRRRSILRSLGRVRDWPESWRQPIGALLDDAPDEVQHDILQAITAAGSGSFQNEILQLARTAQGGLAAAAWRCLAETGVALPEEGFQKLIDLAANADSPLDRLASAQALSRTSLGLPQLSQLIDALPDLAVNERSILASKVRATLSEEDTELDDRFKRWEEQFSKRLDSKAKDESARRELSRLLGQLQPGDVKHGEAVFFSNRAACSACHTVAGKGGDTGPDLSKIGSLRRRPDLLEAIVYPDATIVNSYESYSVLLRDGRTKDGIIQRADSRWLILRDTQRKDAIIAQEEIELLRRMPHSVMPKGLHDHLSMDELSDLLAYLESLGKADEREASSFSSKNR